MRGNAQTGWLAPAYLAKLYAHVRDSLTPDWPTRIAGANTAEQVLQVARSFLEALPLGFLSGLPAPSRPPYFQFAQDVSSYAFTLTHSCIVNDDVDAEMLGMVRFFGVASQRLSVVLTPRGGYTPRPLTPRPPTH